MERVADRTYAIERGEDEKGVSVYAIRMADDLTSLIRSYALPSGMVGIVRCVLQGPRCPPGWESIEVSVQYEGYRVFRRFDPREFDDYRVFGLADAAARHTLELLVFNVVSHVGLAGLRKDRSPR